MLYSTILCATDGLEHSERAAAHAGAIAEKTGAKLHVVSVTEPGGVLLDEYLAGGTAERRELVKEQFAQVADPGRVRVSPHFSTAARGQAAQRIARMADKIDADVIVVGSRDQAPLSAALHGSVSQRLPHLTARPVVVVGAQLPHPRPRSRWRRWARLSAGERERS